MIDTILNFDLDVVLAGLNESSHHLSQMEFISLIVITAGAVLLCLTGLKLVRFWSVIAGLSAGCAAGIAVGAIAGLDQTIALAAGAGVGLVLAVLGAWKKQIGGCDSSGTRLCCQCTFDETTGFYYLWNLCGYWSCVCIAFY